jgi:diaminopimelate decarboxylase
MRQLSEFITVNEQGHLQVEELDCLELAERFGTPLYVTSENQIRHNYRRLYRAFASRYPRVTILFANKSNSNLAVRRILTREGAGGDCFGLGELSVSLLCGTPPEKLVMNGSNKSPKELSAAIETGVAINVDHPEELELVEEIAAALGRRARVNLRVLPFSYADLAALDDDLASIARDTSHDKWGMDRETIRAVAARALGLAHVELQGLHCHVSRLRATAEHFRLGVGLMVECIADLRDRLGWQPEVLDVGGGYAHERDPESGRPAGDHRVASPEEFADAVVTPLRQGLARYGLREPQLHLEPGRRLVSNATILLGRVGIVKRLPSADTTWVNVDMSDNHCLRTSIAGYHYQILNASRADSPDEMTANVTGPTCTMDLLGAGRPLPRTERGDLLAVLDVGGYAEVLATQFNTMPRPVSVLVSGSQADVIRRRETIQDVLATQQVPPRLMAPSQAGVTEPALTPA